MVGRNMSIWMLPVVLLLGGLSIAMWVAPSLTQVLSWSATETSRPGSTRPMEQPPSAPTKKVAAVPTFPVSPSRQGGSGGQGGAFLPGRVRVPFATLAVFGGTGPGGACKGTMGPPAALAKQDFGWDVTILSPQYRTDTTDVLCNDKWPWQSTMVLATADVLQTLGWPPDLVLPQFRFQRIAVQPLANVDAKTQQVQEQAAYQATLTTGACDWVPNLLIVQPHIDICAPFVTIAKATSNGLKGTITAVLNQVNSFLWTTPTAPFTSATSGLLDIWNISWGIVLAVLSGVIAWACLRYMVAGVAASWLSYAGVIELLPRILFGLLVAYLSKDIFVMILSFSNALSSLFHTDGVQSMINSQPTDFLTIVMQIIYVLMSILLVIEEAARVAVLYLLFAFAPVLFFLASLRETQGVAKAAVTGSILFALVQPMQEATLDVGGRVLSSVLQGHAGQLGLLNFLVAIAILAITLMLFLSIARVALGSLFSPVGFAATGLALGAALAGGRTAGIAGRGVARGLTGLPRRVGRRSGSPSSPSSSSSSSNPSSPSSPSSGGKGRGSSSGPGGPGSGGSGGSSGGSSSSSPSRSSSPSSGSSSGSSGGGRSPGGGFGQRPPQRPPGWKPKPFPKMRPLKPPSASGGKPGTGIRSSGARPRNTP